MLHDGIDFSAWSNPLTVTVPTMGFFSPVFMFSPKTKIIYSAQYRPKLLQFSQPAQFGGEFNIYKYMWGWCRTKIQLCPNLGERLPKGQKCKNCLYLSQSIENVKLYYMFKNRPPRSIRREDVRDFPVFDLEKWLFLPYRSLHQIERTSWNLVSALSWGPYKCLLLVLTF